jgi:GR25 family glycosyltransferase involved in LPS biosynthesis
VAIRELVRKNVLPATYQIHHAERIKDNRFFKENVLTNIEIETLPVTFVEKDPFYQWVATPSILFSHARFTNLRMGLLNALWMGLPLVHNSPILCNLHPVLQSTFYMGNHIEGMMAAFSYLHANPTAWYAARNAIRSAMMHTFGIEGKQVEWIGVVGEVCSAVPLPLMVASPAPPAPPAPSAPPAPPSPFIPLDGAIRIAFSDMWPGFNYDCNFIMDALRHEDPSHTFHGTTYDASSQPPHLVICGPYSTNWKAIPSIIPKVYFSAENWTIPSENAFALYLTSQRMEDTTHLRVPTWMTFVDWFTTSTTLPTNVEDNPIRLPVSLAMNPHPVPFEQRSQFCGFVVSNGVCEFRNKAFETMNNYKPVNSGGALYNNIGGQLSLKYPGGGCGDISKHHFFAEHKFTISFENAQSPGYITEKLLHAKMAGCVPLYWGDADTTSDFVPNSFINVSHVRDPALLVPLMKKLEAHPDMCAKIAATPLLDETKKQNALHVISTMCRKLLAILRIEPVKKEIAGIQKTFVINLDTRPDRWEKLMAAEPYLQPLVERVSGVNGKTLTMTQEIYDMFDRNEFQWKKSIIGCNLSHISVWKKIAQEKDGYYLVLEDDVRFQPGWREQWETYVKDIPDDADLLYLGGVLPPNKGVLPMATEHVNAHWSKIKPNTFFSPVPTPVFHFCAYSYILTPRGAQRLMSYLTNSDKKSFTVSDHLLGHPSIGLTKYFTNPLLSYCFQEEDPIYTQSQFNDLHREDTFDSDIWNNKECFTVEDLTPFFMKEPVKELALYHIEQEGEVNLYEDQWLKDMMGITFHPSPLRPETEIVPYTWFLIQRPHVQRCAQMLHQLNAMNIPFKVLHLSDEFGTDDISFYSLPWCRAVIRNYVRPDVPQASHIVTIPLGYHHKAVTQKAWEQRDLVWSFHGTDWFDRQTQLNSFSSLVPHSCHLQPDWNHPTATKEKSYLSILGNSKFCPILKGNNEETFRLYEALEAGTLPVTTISNPVYLQWFNDQMGLSSLYAWTNPSLTMQSNTITEDLRMEVGRRWSSWKQRVMMACRELL